MKRTLRAVDPTQGCELENSVNELGKLVVVDERCLTVKSTLPTRPISISKISISQAKGLTGEIKRIIVALISSNRVLGVNRFPFLY